MLLYNLIMTDLRVRVFINLTVTKFGNKWPKCWHFPLSIYILTTIYFACHRGYQIILIRPTLPQHPMLICYRMTKGLQIYAIEFSIKWDLTTMNARILMVVFCFKNYENAGKLKRKNLQILFYIKNKSNEWFCIYDTGFYHI